MNSISLPKGALGMLLHLRIKNLAVIEDASMAFGPGLNVITGETGAGKSIVAQALHIVLGERARNDWIREGARAAEVEALFRFPLSFPLIQRLVELEWLDGDVPGDGAEVLIRRVLSATGRSRVFVNGHLTTLALLSELMRGVVDRTDQHAHTLLTTREHQLGLLDRFAGSCDEARAYRVAFEEFRALERSLCELQCQTQERLQREDFLRFQLKEYDDISPTDGEDELLVRERDRLAGAGELSEAALQIEGILAGNSASLIVALSEVAKATARSAALDPTLAALVERLKSSRIELEDIAYESRRYADGLESDPTLLERMDARLFKLEKLRRRFGPDWSDVFAHFEVLRGELDAVENADERLADLAGERDRALSRAETLAHALSTTRKAASRVLEEEVARQLDGLAMPGASIRFNLRPSSGLGPSGADDVELQIATNKGDGLRGLERVASGGERSRLLLALKRVLADANEVPIAIFDEIDAGVGGRVSEAVGRKLLELSHSGQVITITHLAPIAAMGDRHHVVTKDLRSGRATTCVGEVFEDGRLREIARMLGGRCESQGANDHARELLQLSLSR